jgi:hypothetical protein
MKFKYLLCLVLLLTISMYLMAQPDLPPDGDTGGELDSVPIAGGIIYFIVSLIIGGWTLIKKKKMSE